jgi:(2S)-methylsuccinyl-CoA dehydrogenase
MASARQEHTTIVSRTDEEAPRSGLRDAVRAIEGLVAIAKSRLRDRVTEAGAPLRAGPGKVGVTPTPAPRVSSKLLDQRQLAAHALAYMATELEAARQLSAWADRNAGPLDRRIADAYVGELVRTLRGGVDLGACESVSLADLEIKEEDLERTIGHRAIVAWASEVSSAEEWCAIAKAAHELGTFGTLDAGGEDDGTFSAIREEFRKFVDREVVPIAQEVHRKDVLIPMDLIHEMSELGVFGLTIPEAYGGQGMGKVAMCVVTEELSRGYIGVGSLGTRAEIAAELILAGGTEQQKRTWLPRIAAGEILPTAVFTEPNNGSDLAHARARAERQHDGSYAFHGQKTWITHATRADLMTALMRTDPSKSGYEGLSMFLAPKHRATVSEDFPDAGVTGTEIKVLGYRGMKEFELSFDGFKVGPEALLGGVEGQGFKQLMATFESARIQTAARGVGVAQAALEEAMRYAHERVQFGVPIASFPRVARKLGRMIARIMAARQLAFFAARAKDSGKRCDLEAGMAKLLATRAAWEGADACVQIHGGNGYAEEYVASRLLVDARVLSIFEGANEIQAQVVARRLLE